MTGIHTCSYECERPECIRAQRDELAARMTAQQPEARGGGKVEDGPIDASDNAEYIEHCADRLERCGLRVTAGALRVIAHEHRTLAQQQGGRDHG